jgi:hypothetical protein
LAGHALGRLDGGIAVGRLLEDFPVALLAGR